MNYLTLPSWLAGKKLTPTSRWTYVVLAVVIAIVWIQLPIAFNNDEKALEPQKISKWPVLKSQQIVADLNELSAILHNEDVSTFERYYELLGESERLRYAIQRNNLVTRTSRWSDDYAAREAIALRQHELRPHNLSLKLSNDALEWRQDLANADWVAFEKVRDEYEAQQEFLYGLDRSGDTFGSTFKLCYGLTMLLMIPFFIVRLERSKKLVNVELLGPEFWFWVLCWPVGLFKYPEYVVTKKQVERAKKWAGAIIGAALSCSPVAMAQTKAQTKTKTGGTDTEWVLEASDHRGLVTIEPPLRATQVTPRIVFGDSKESPRLDLFGWTTFECNDALDGCDMSWLRGRAVVDGDGWELFSQFNFRNTSLSDGSAVDALWLEFSGLGDGKWQVGRFFSASINALQAPFLQEVITGPRVPVLFFTTGLKYSGAMSENITYEFDVTGLGGTTSTSSEQFDEIGFAGNIKRQGDKGFVRAAIARSSDTRFIVDGERGFGSNLVRGAVHYRTEGGSAGAYVFAERKLPNGWSIHSQVDVVDGDWRALVGGRYVANDHVTVTGEYSADGPRLRVVGRF